MGVGDLGRRSTTTTLSAAVVVYALCRQTALGRTRGSEGVADCGGAPLPRYWKVHLLQLSTKKEKLRVEVSPGVSLR